MSNIGQVDAVKRALDLEKQIAQLKRRLSTLKGQAFAKPPAAPVRETVSRTYPTIHSTIAFWKLGLLPLMVGFVIQIAGGFIDSSIVLIGAALTFLSIIWIPVYYFAIFRNRKKRNIEEIGNSAAYRETCAGLDEEYDRQQAELDRQYREARTQYDNTIYPQYEKARNEWNEKHYAEIAETADALRNAEEQLSSHYENTKIVPLQYHTIDALQFMYNLMSTSEYDVKEAIELYDRSEQRKIDEARLRAIEESNQLAAEQNAMLDEQNAMLDEQNAIAEQARRDQNVAAVIGAVQRHSINKSIKNLRR